MFAVTSGVHSGADVIKTFYDEYFAVLDLPGQAVREIYGHDLLLVRPDMHVVWRGNRPPDDAGLVAATTTGHRRP